MSHHTERLGAWIAGLRFEDIPAPVVAHAKPMTFDSTGCGLLGATMQRASAAERLQKESPDAIAKWRETCGV